MIHNDFYQWIEKNNLVSQWKTWTPSEWHPTDDNFCDGCDGWKGMVEAYQGQEPFDMFFKKFKQTIIKEISFKEFLELIITKSEEVLKKAWYKANIIGLSSQEENEIKELIDFIVSWECRKKEILNVIIHTEIAYEYKSLSDISLKDWTMKTRMLGASQQVLKDKTDYFVYKGVKLLDSFHFAVKWKTVELPEPKFAIKDGVFMAISKERINENFNKLLTIGENK